ncbi:MAG: hypothetical protein OXC30_02685 [Alphaproteobacteria bacterium]|nr:hypothetical protein [Alphaproteobacteria bacterium]
MVTIIYIKILLLLCALILHGASKIENTDYWEAHHFSPLESPPLDTSQPTHSMTLPETSKSPRASKIITHMAAYLRL